MSSRDPASWDTRLGNSTFSFDALSLQQGFYLCPGCQTPGLASATLTPCVQGQGGSASTLRSGISRPHLQHSGIHVPEHRKKGAEHPAPGAWRGAHAATTTFCTSKLWAPVPSARCLLPITDIPEIIPVRYRLGISDLNTLFWTWKLLLFLMLQSLYKPAHVTNCLFPNSCCVTLLPTPWDVACHSFNGLGFTGKCLGEPLSSLISNRRGQSLLEVAGKHLWGLLRIREAEKGPFPAGKTLTFIQPTLQCKGLNRWGRGVLAEESWRNEDGLSRQERSICEGGGGKRRGCPWPSQVVHCSCHLSFI